MFSASTETYVAWITWLLLLAFLLAVVSGTLSLMRSRRERYFQVRREAVVRGWQLVLAGIGMLIGAMLVIGLGTPLLRLAVPATLTAAPSLTPSNTLPPPTQTASLTPLPSPTGTATEGPTPTATDTASPTISPTPVLPVLLITPILTATVTPPAEAIAAEVRFSRRDDCTVPGSQGFFDQLPKTIYAHFFYNNWLPGVQWSGVWLRNGEVIYTETHLWDGSTGGCGFSNYDGGKMWWPEGNYEVQIFVGDRWLTSSGFAVVRSTPTATITATRTPRTPSPAPTASNTATPRTPPAPSASTPATASAGHFPPGVIARAVVALRGAATSARLRQFAPDGPVVAVLTEGTPVEVLQDFVTIDAITWREVRLQDGGVGWIADYLLLLTET